MRTIAIVITALILLVTHAHATDNTSLQYKNIIKQYKGNVIYLDFWASWCTPCRKSFPWMNKIQKKYADKNFKVISINLDAEPNLAKQFLASTPANFTILNDPNGKLAQELQLKGMPSSFIINAEGKIVSAHVGFTDKKKVQYEQEIEQLL
ncbi:TlpA disulfide reductase family protein [Colwellia sp. RSH04]|uniref:TlpA family protein disulfide reductase n=1 Tax=Colwellia sp. RSH04 TaxID=2305464 RepID=UPI000E57C1FA|nr:TlpA disulfide reductase family protein [Colwellia sp. RSH04]RHW77215.1 TlpA family protein disulfide reductase [Colwellia sp. RSH04]